MLKELPASSYPHVSDVPPAGHTDNAAAPSLFMCNSDKLYFKEHLPALAAGHILLPGQIYFVLEMAMLEKPQSSLNCRHGRAGRACQHGACSVEQHQAVPPSWRRACGGGKKKVVRVMPMHEEVEDEGEDMFFINEKLNKQTLGEFVGSPAKRDEKLGVTSRLKRALSIIQEDAK